MVINVRLSVQQSLPNHEGDWGDSILINLSYIFCCWCTAWPDALQEFVAAGAPREAIDMWLHAQRWEDALRIAETHDPSTIPDIFVAQVCSPHMQIPSSFSMC